jgi:hypothetical protein
VYGYWYLREKNLNVVKSEFAIGKIVRSDGEERKYGEIECKREIK